MGIKTKIAGSGYVVLNIFRGLNVISLLASIGAAVAMLIKVFFRNGFGFFDTISHVLTVLMSIFLILSELPFGPLKSWFMTNWPLLSIQSSFITLGIFMIIDGAMVLANLNSDNVTSETFGLAFIQIIQAGGILTFIMGVLNILISFVFRDRKVGVTARMIRASGATAAGKIANDIHWKNNERTDLEQVQRSPSVRTVVFSSSDRLPLHNPPAMARSEYTASVYSQATAAAPTNYRNEGKANADEMPDIHSHPAFKHGTEFV